MKIAEKVFIGVVIGWTAFWWYVVMVKLGSWFPPHTPTLEEIDRD